MEVIKEKRKEKKTKCSQPCKECVPICRGFKKFYERDAELIEFLRRDNDEETEEGDNKRLNVNKEERASNAKEDAFKHRPTVIKKTPASGKENQPFKCFKCDIILEQVNGLLDEIKTIKQNEAQGLCQHCKLTCFSSKCKRCYYLINKYLSDKMNQHKIRQQEYKMWLTKVKQVLVSILQSETICRHKEHVVDTASNQELQNLLKELKKPLFSRDLEIGRFPISEFQDTFDISDSLTASKDILEMVLKKLKAEGEIPKSKRKVGASQKSSTQSLLSGSLPSLRTKYEMLQAKYAMYEKSIDSDFAFASDRLEQEFKLKIAKGMKQTQTTQKVLTFGTSSDRKQPVKEPISKETKIESIMKKIRDTPFESGIKSHKETSATEEMKPGGLGISDDFLLADRVLAAGRLGQVLKKKKQDTERDAKKERERAAKQRDKTLKILGKKSITDIGAKTSPETRKEVAEQEKLSSISVGKSLDTEGEKPSKESESKLSDKRMSSEYEKGMIEKQTETDEQLSGNKPTDQALEQEEKEDKEEGVGDEYGDKGKNKKEDRKETDDISVSNKSNITDIGAKTTPETRKEVAEQEKLSSISVGKSLDTEGEKPSKESESKLADKRMSSEYDKGMIEKQTETDEQLSGNKPTDQALEQEEKEDKKGVDDKYGDKGKKKKGDRKERDNISVSNKGKKKKKEKREKDADEGRKKGDQKERDNILVSNKGKKKKKDKREKGEDEGGDDSNEEEEFSDEDYEKRKKQKKGKTGAGDELGDEHKTKKKGKRGSDEKVKLKPSESAKLLLKLLKEKGIERAKKENMKDKSSDEKAKKAYEKKLAQLRKRMEKAVNKMPDIHQLGNRFQKNKRSLGHVRSDFLTQSGVEDDIKSEFDEVNTVTEMIKGDQVVPFDPHYKDEPPDPEKTVFYKVKQEFPVLPPPKPPPATQKTADNVSDKKSLKDEKYLRRLSEVDFDINAKGIFRYALSNPEYIDLGYTKLPTIKVMRRMNVYKMVPINPKQNWFERHKSKRILFYNSNEKLAEIDDDGHGRWYYKNGITALDYYKAEEEFAENRYVVYSSGENDAFGNPRFITILASFDHLGNGVVYDNKGNLRLKYNQCEGTIIDEKIGPPGRWKWHSLNDPPVLQTVYLDNYLDFNERTTLYYQHHQDLVMTQDYKDHKDYKGHKDHKDHEADEQLKQKAEENMLAVEHDTFVKQRLDKLKLNYKPFQIRLKAFKINDQFSLHIVDQRKVYLMFRDGLIAMKLNLGMNLISNEIIYTEMSESSDVLTPLDRSVPKSLSVANLKNMIDGTKKTYEYLNGKKYGVNE